MTLCLRRSEFEARRSVKDKEDSGRRHLLVHGAFWVILQAAVSFLFKDFTNRLAPGKGSFTVDEMRLGHLVSVRKVTSNASQELGVRCSAFKRGNIWSQNQWVLCWHWAPPSTSC